MKVLFWQKSAIAFTIMGFTHFFFSFYVPGDTDLRDQQLPQVELYQKAQTYNPELLLKDISLLNAASVVSDEDARAAREAEAINERFDSWHLAGQSMALMAIYQQKQPVALFWLKASPTSPAELVRLKRGEQHKDVTLGELTSTTATLQFKDQTRVLRLFTPGTKEKQSKHQDSGN